MLVLQSQSQLVAESELLGFRVRITVCSGSLVVESLFAELDFLRVTGELAACVWCVC